MTIPQFSLYLFLLVALSGCVDPYDPGLVGGERYLVFDGVLTDAPGPYRFSLSQSAGYNSSEGIYDQRVTGAMVSVSDDAGQVTTFADDDKGTFTSPITFRGQVGRRYSLTIMHKGQTYRTDPELMQTVPPIDSLYWAYQPKITATQPGNFAVYLNLTDPANAENYYQWDWAHYEQPDFCVLYRPSGSNVSYARLCCSDCWNIVRSTGKILLATDRLINGNRLAGQAIAEVPFDDTSPYYLAVGQQSLSKGAYQFWQSVQALTGNVGSVFDAAPATLSGNIRNQNPAGLPALGYFQVSARRQRVVYINRLGTRTEPFAKTTYPLWTTCEPCIESLYRTGVQPEGWRK